MRLCVHIAICCHPANLEMVLCVGVSDQIVTNNPGQALLIEKFKS